jgi:hypothetical protein
VNDSGNLNTEGELHVNKNVVCCTTNNTGITCSGYGYFDGDVDAIGYVYARGGLYTDGNKPRVVATPDFSKRLLYAFETPSPMFADVGSGVIDESGTSYIFIETVFAETVETQVEYQVFLQKYGNGDCWVSERNPGYFVVSGTPGLSFGWEIHAKQRDYDQCRLEEFRPDDDKAVKAMLSGDYGDQAADFIENYYREFAA